MGNPDLSIDMTVTDSFCREVGATEAAIEHAIRDAKRNSDADLVVRLEAKQKRIAAAWAAFNKPE